MSKKALHRLTVLALLFIISIGFLFILSCSSNPAEPESKVFNIWTLESNAGQGILYYNSPGDDFKGDGINLTGISATMILRYLAHGEGKLWSTESAEWLAKKIAKIDPKTGAVIERNIPDILIDSQPQGLAWSNGYLWGVFLVNTGFMTYKIDPVNFEATQQTQFSFSYNPNTRRIRGIDIDDENNLLWVGCAQYPFDSWIYYISYDAYNLTSGAFVKSVQPGDVYFDLWAGDIKVGEDYIWSTNWDDLGEVIILKTDKESGAVQRIEAIDAGGNGIVF